ncbi:MAG TPA: S53 family peptidase [Candidatus Baltobacteraceae bacterium]|nr:S53 family peptidase [Candidatus Baltobacteraceae bacterium]
MLKTFRILAAAAAAALLAACSSNGASSIPSTGSPLAPNSLRTLANPSQAQLGRWPRAGRADRVCGPVSRGFARCAAWIRTDLGGLKGPQFKNAAISGYHPVDLQTAYALSTSGGSGVTVAIVDAYHDPNAASDLAAYRSQFGLPAGHFTQYSLGTKTNTGWAEEESLDVDMVSAICPNCNILLVEAATNSDANLNKAEQYATAHANYVSNSWSGGETSASSADNYYNFSSGKIVAAATGDNGYNSTAQWPAVLPYVIAVGGTHLASTNPRSESAWTGAGSGCSNVYAKPSWQTMNVGCTKRAQSDVSAVADPNTGVAVYDTFHTSGWLVFGGTSVATPVITSVFALTGNTNGNPSVYANASHLNDVSGGKNGSCGAPLCTSGAGWDGPTGLGSPNGTGAF